jgi:dTDP-4-amino-4,6-dideoxygalactose transaminase
MKIPFLDLRAQYESIRDEINAVIAEVLESSAFSGGPFVARFEQQFAEYCGSGYCVAVGSGTEALWLILLGLGIGAGDEVITVPNTFIATVEAIRFCGATPIFVDVDATTYTMDPALLERAITVRTKAVIPVHLFGQTADMDPITATCKKHGLYVIEDACQAHGAEYKGRRAGSLGHAAAFSFYPGKNLGAYGEAGAITTRNQGLADKVRMIRDHGQSKKYYHELNGWNARMDGIQGAVLSVKLRHLERWNRARIKHAERYCELLDREKVVVPITAGYARHVFHVYAVRVRQRDVILERLKNEGVSCGIHYPVPVHLQGASRGLGFFKASCPVAEQNALELLSLPMFAELQPEQVARVSEAVNVLAGEPAAMR